MASTYLTRSVSTTGNRRTWTFSAWVKRSNTTQQYQNMFAAGSNNIRINFSNQNIWVYDYNGSGFDFYLVTNRLFRDTNAFYHIVVAVDTTQATSSDRVKLYINGVQETSFSTETYPSQNHDTEANTSGENNVIGTDAGSLGSNSFDGIMSHVHWIDGTAYNASAFGETDANGVWTINTSPSVTYGTNGFFILKDSASVTDQSGNGNNFTVGGGTLTDTLDCPANVFATLNPLVASYSAITYSNGNLKATYPGTWTGTHATLGASSGKYYWEIKSNTTDSSGGNGWHGVVSENVNMSSSTLYSATEGQVMIKNNGDLRINNSTTSSYGSAYSNGDIVGIAVDLDSATKTIQFYKNGTTNGSLVNLPTNMQDTFIIPFVMGNSSTNAINHEANFGNGYFGSTAVSSAGTNASGIGIFEYDVPTGYTALSTKGLNL